jgi:hypothetical protein
MTDVAAIGDPHDAVTVSHMVDEPMAESIVTIAEPLPSSDIAHASLTELRPAPAVRGIEFGPDGTLRPAAQAATTASEPWLVDPPSAAPARSGLLTGLLASRKRLVIAGVGALLLGIVLVAVLTGGGSKQPATSAARGTTDKVAKADPPKDETPTEPAPTPVEVGSAEPQAGSAEAPIVDPGAADGSAGSAAAPEPMVEPVPEPTPVKATAETPKPAPKPAVKKAVKRVAAKPAAKKPVAKTVTKTATKTTKPAVQKPGAKKPAWDPNSLLPPKKK